MKYFFSILCLLAFANCHSKLDNPTNLPLMLDTKTNANLKISIEAFLENPVNKSFLKSECYEINQGGSFHFIYSKDSSFVHLKDDIVIETNILSKGEFLNYGIEIGQTKSDFIAHFVPFVNRTKAPYVAIQANKIEFGCCEMGKSVWTFYFNNEILKKVEFLSNQTNNVE